MLDVRNKFGGSAPDSLSEYYRGGAFVPNVVGCFGVPTAGPISISQLESAFLTSSSTTILSHVWNNRTTHFFHNPNNGAWAWTGDTYVMNAPIARFTSSYTTNGAIAPAAPNYSNWTTLIGFAAGSSATITSMSSNVGLSLYQLYNINEMSWWVIHTQSLPTAITSVALTASRSGGNSGSWPKLLVLPGRWAIDTGAITNNMAMGWSRTLAPGRVGWFATGSGYDGDMTPPSAGTVANIIKGSEFWYNNSVSYVQLNPSGGNYTFRPGDQTGSYGAPAGVWTYNRTYLEFFLFG
jgi:hypothetical protein